MVDDGGPSFGEHEIDFYLSGDYMPTTVVDQLIVLILDFQTAHPQVPLEDIKNLVKQVGEITSDFTMDVVKEQINKTFHTDVDN